MDIVVLATRASAHHFRNLENRLEGRFVYESVPDPKRILAHRPRLVVCFDEHYCELGYAIAELKKHGVATLQVMDGILEWRRTWDYTRQGLPIDGVANPINQPAFAHKIACLGRRDARILESWGNAGKCEIVGAPRMDDLVRLRMQGLSRDGMKVRERLPRILIVTAKTPGFTPKQIETTRRSLACLKRFFDAYPMVEPTWRITRGLERELGIENRLSDLTGAELHVVLREVDAVITTPSTTMLESMLLDLPTSLLDFHNCPHYFEAAWCISAEDHIASVIEELVAPSKPRMDYQRFLLADQLACVSPASERLLRLIEEMLAIRADQKGLEIVFPAAIVNIEPAAPLKMGSYRDRYPEFPVPDDLEMREVRVELAAARGCVRVLRERIAELEAKRDSIPGVRLFRSIRDWLRRR